MYISSHVTDACPDRNLMKQVNRFFLAADQGLAFAILPCENCYLLHFLFFFGFFFLSPPIFPFPFFFVVFFQTANQPVSRL